MILLFLPTQMGMGRYVARQQTRIQRIADQRLRVMAEVLASIKLVKLYAWESSFAQHVRSPPSSHPFLLHLLQVNAIRARESSQLLRTSLIKLQNTTFFFVVPTIATYVVFFVYSLLGGTMTPSLVFTVTSLMESTRYFLDYFQYSINGISGRNRLQPALSSYSSSPLLSSPNQSLRGCRLHSAFPLVHALARG